MELFQELFLTASLALLLSFLVAKLVSMALAGDACYHESRLKSGRNVGEGLTTMEELRFGERLTVPGYESERKVREVIEEASSGRRSMNLKAESVSTARGDPDFQASRTTLNWQKNYWREEIVGLAEKLSGETIEESGTVEKSLESRVNGESSTEKEVVPESEENSVNVEKGVERRMEVESAPEKEVVPESEELSRVVESEVREKVEEKEISYAKFILESAAAKFILESASGGKEGLLATAGVGSDVKMDLYGLHKIATEGPCRDPQPMSLKFSARTKWEPEHKTEAEGGDWTGGLKV
ncbi:Acyl-CoA-binding domain-containing protein 3 [Morella rubra]|uniref:Acyl-CoA-binding domain-containing protein 3 n=1 Tax=Morella rubra TaxID=262757 RepID=A0A6A1UQ78_9ROSI|nr:Acyl-CoA-binding domain-containing protein 3 [Morella rubra]